MIKPDQLNAVRSGTCAIGFLTTSLEEYLLDPMNPYLKIVGTGFVVKPMTAITNRHVIEALKIAQADFGFQDGQRMLLFVWQKNDGQLQAALRNIRAAAMHSDRNFDVGFVDFRREPAEHLEGSHPVPIAEQWNTQVTEEIAVCGYPHGHLMLQKEPGGRVYRWGPVVQQGHVSAVSPYDIPPAEAKGVPPEVLLDVRCAEGMSGAPIFRPQDGKVIGILHSTTMDATTALGLPLTQPIVDAWLTVWESMKAQNKVQQSE